jgi:phosphoribosylformylglycinamidine synthase
LLTSTDDIIGKDVRDGHVALVIGESNRHLGQSALLAEAFNRSEGDAPPVDLDAEKRNGDFIRANAGLIKACTDLSDGGLALAAFELAEAANVGVHLDSEDTGLLFGEDQARYLVACNTGQAETLMLTAVTDGVPIELVGRFTGDAIRFGKCTAPLEELAQLYRNAFAAAVA